MKSIGAIVAVAACLVMAIAPARSAQPNVVLFLVDDMGWMDSSTYGSQYYETPNMDRFAKRSMRFTNAYANPLCSPSRASIMTGKHPTRHGILTASGHQPPQPAEFEFMPKSGPANRAMVSPISKNYLDPGEYTLAEVLRDAGYRTAHIGKWHLGLTEPYRPEAQGFDVAFHCAPDPGPPSYFSPYGVVSQGNPTPRNRVGTITDGPDGEYIVDRQGIEAVRFIRESKSQPFFLNLWCYGVHGPWGHKPEYTAEFAKKVDPRGVQSNAIMASMMKSVDECFGKILDELDAQGLSENTLVIFYSDNGGNVHSNVSGTGKTEAAERHRSEMMADWRKWAGNQPPTNNHPLREGKSSLYEGGTRVPLMWALPGRIAPGTTSDAIVGHIDLYPTILDLVGITKPHQQVIDGISIAALLTGKTDSIEREAFFNFFPFRPYEGGVTVRKGDFKLIRWFDPSVSRELYDLGKDIGESQNLAESMPERVAELDALIDGFLQDTGALIPQPNPAYRPRPSPPAVQDAAFARGLVPKGCELMPVEGALRIEPAGRNPFLGTAQVRLRGPISLTISARAAAGWSGKIQWRRAEQTDLPDDQVVEFQLPAEPNTQEITVNLPVQGRSGIIRLYVPADHAVEIESLRYRGADGASHMWDFSQQP